MPKHRKILVTGGTGQLGRSLKSIARYDSGFEFVFSDRQNFDFCNNAQIAEFFDANAFDIIINCAAYTAVDRAEDEPDLANQINNLAVRQLALVARKNRIKFIHVSTDYVFNGETFKPYLERDETAPISVYGETKLQGERAALNLLERGAVVIRTSWIYSEFGTNFLKTMLALGRKRDSLSVIYDQIGTPTYARDLASAIMAIAESNLFNKDFDSHILHFSGEGVCSWYDFANTIFELEDISCELTAIETGDYPARALRPHYSVLNKTKIKRMYDVTIPYWKDSVKDCLSRLQREHV